MRSRRRLDSNRERQGPGWVTGGSEGSWCVLVGPTDTLSHRLGDARRRRGPAKIGGSGAGKSGLTIRVLESETPSRADAM